MNHLDRLYRDTGPKSCSFDQLPADEQEIIRRERERHGDDGGEGR